METDSSLSGKGNEPDERTGAPADPFATDLFVAARAPRSAATAASSQTPAPTSQTSAAAASFNAAPWYARLPRLAREQLRLSRALAALPPLLVGGARDALARVVARYANVAAEQVEIASDGAHESTAPVHAAGKLTADASVARRVWTTLTARDGGSSATVVAELDAAFAAALVDHMLGGEGTPPESLRGLSQTEQAVVEFLWLAIAREMNKMAGATVWRVERVTNDASAAFAGNSPGSLDTTDASGAFYLSDASPTNLSEADGARKGQQRYIVVVARIRLASLEGACRLYLNDSALRALDASRNRLFDAESRSHAARLARLRRIAPDVSLRLFIGETDATAAEVALLKAGDVVIVARPLLEWNGAAFRAENAEVRAGAGRGVLLGGRLNVDVATGEEDAQDDASAMRGGGVVARMMLETISSGETAAVASERVDMEEDDLNGADGESGVALDHLLLTLHVELPARRISLDELARLRAGQFLDLGCRPTDPVELVADGRRIARGELIDFEGQLGVRITEVNG